MGVFLLGRISFALVITFFAKFLLREEIAKEKIRLINKNLTEKISNFDEVFYLAIDNERLPLVELIEYLISNIYILSVRVNEINDYDLSFLLFYVFILCPIFSFFLGFLFFSFENFSNLSSIVEEIRKEISSYLICNMLPASKKIALNKVALVYDHKAAMEQPLLTLADDNIFCKKTKTGKLIFFSFLVEKSIKIYKVKEENQYFNFGFDTSLWRKNRIEKSNKSLIWPEEKGKEEISFTYKMIKKTHAAFTDYFLYTPLAFLFILAKVSNFFHKTHRLTNSFLCLRQVN